MMINRVMARQRRMPAATSGDHLRLVSCKVSTSAQQPVTAHIPRPAHPRLIAVAACETYGVVDKQQGVPRATTWSLRGRCHAVARPLRRV